MSLELQSYEKLCEIEKILRTIMQWTVEMQTIRLSTDLPTPDYTAEVVDYTDTAPAPSRRRGRPPKDRS